MPYGQGSAHVSLWPAFGLAGRPAGIAAEWGFRSDQVEFNGRGGVRKRWKAKNLGAGGLRVVGAVA